MYSIGNKNNTEIDKFEGIVNSIIDEYIETTLDGSIKYGGITSKLCKETILICDEEQDLPPNYAEAIIKIMRNRYIDVYVVGDKLQSITNQVNSFTYLLENDFSYIDKIMYEKTNECRRFNHPALINFVNDMIPFAKYNLPEIHKPHHMSNSLLPDSPIVIFKGGQIHANCKEENKINEEIDEIMMFYEKEVSLFERIPEDFLIVTPFTNMNPLVNALQLAINVYWENKYSHDTFRRYAIFHKSEVGTSIDLNESINATRIVSIHSSKGDGRKVVFVIGLNESGLKIYSGVSDSLIYDSLLHVAITRMKEKLYVRYDNDNDDIYRRLQHYANTTDIEFENYDGSIQIKSKIKFDTMKDICKTTNNYQILKDNIFDLINLSCLKQNEDERSIIDLGHHNVRFAAIVAQIHLQIIRQKNEQFNTNVKYQINAKWRTICKAVIIDCFSWKDYNNRLIVNYEGQFNSNCSKSIPILKMSKNGREYIMYYKIIKSFMENIRIKMKSILNGDDIHNFCPMECIIIHYMLESINNGIYTSFSITELYNVVDIYSKSFIMQPSHNHCICNDCFTIKTGSDYSNSKIDSLKTYICVHFEKINKVSCIFTQIYSLYPNISWLINHHVLFNGKNTDFKIYKFYQLIGYDNDNVIIAYIKPQFNSLNYNQILMDAVFDAYLVKNVNEKENNYKRFHGKKISCVVITTDLNEPYYIDLTTDVFQQNQTIIQSLIKNAIFSKFANENNIVYQFYKYWRKTCPFKQPFEIINYIIQHIPTDDDNPVPTYILDFFNNIKFKIENSDDKQEQKNVLKNYDNKMNFIKYLEHRLSDSLIRYFESHLYDQNVNESDNDDTGFVSD